MENENLEQPQVSEPETKVEDAVETPQPESEVTEEQPAAEDKKAQVKPKEKKQFSPEEQVEIDRIISERTARMRKDADDAQKQAASIRMQQQIERAQAEETRAKAKDKQDVDNGLISEEQAGQRAQERQRSEQIRQTLRQQEAAADSLGRVMLAEELVKEYKESGVDLDRDTLVNDKSLTDPTLMIRKAANLAIASLKAQLKEATAKPESFDKGPGTSTGGEDSFSGTITQEQLDDDKYWSKHKDAILKAQREGKLKVI